MTRDLTREAEHILEQALRRMDLMGYKPGLLPSSYITAAEVRAFTVERRRMDRGAA